MALTAAQLEAILTLDKSQFERALGQAEQTAQKSGQGFKDWGAGVGKAMNDGIVLAATGAAGFAAAVTSVGVEYNSLQQRSRAALSTILDGSEAANAQMDKLDDFASNSPFARDVFIKAQQQLLGFGQEAERVVPTLEAVQDAVAATGGSNEDIAELVRIIAQLEGGVKLSAETLNQFGARGIDAAGIIGDAMGKTGEQIRTEITEGALDADEAIVALTDGMTERFGGAAANVKETWDGATDRIKAATRDIGAEIARPFVDPNGGGRAIDWANDFADVLRAVERQVPSLISVLDDKLEPSFDNFRVTMKDAVETIDNWDASDLEGILERLSGHAPGIAGLSAAMFVMASSNIPVIGGLTSALGPLPAAIGAAALASPEMREGLSDILDAGAPLIGVLGDLAGVASGTFTTALELTGDVLSSVSDLIGPVVEWFADLPEPIRNAATAAAIFAAVRGPVTNTLGRISTNVQNTFQQFQGWDRLFENAGNDALTFGTKLEIARSQLGMNPNGGLRGALGGIMSIFGGPWGIAVMGATALLGHYAQEQAEAKERVDELASSLDEQTGAFTESTEEMVANRIASEVGLDTLDDLGIGVNDVTDAIMGEKDANELVTQAIKRHSDEMEANGESLTDTQDKLLPLETLIREEAEALDEASEAALENAEANRRRNSELDEGERSHRRMTESLAEAVDETINMNDRVQALNDALDELNGATATQEERDRNLASTQRDLGSFFENNAEEIGKMDEALIDMSDGLPSKTELGDELNRMLEGMAGEANKAAIAAYDLAQEQGLSSSETKAAIEEAYKPYIGTLQDLAEQGYLTEEEVSALTTAIIGVPEITSFLITHNETVSQTERDVLGLIGKIEGVPDGATYITDNETSQAVVDELENLGYKTERLPDGTVEITPIGIPEAEAAVNEFVNKDRILNIDVDVADFSGQIRNGLMRFNADSRSHANILAPRYAGGIDRFKGMAAGGFSVMDFAQMVSPGDIRFAGDRTDVDEAWIPLDGSQRSVAILEEAIRRMPGYEQAEGMADGGITGTLTPPQVEAVDAPDTTQLQDVWAETMATLEESTRASFATIEEDTATSQEATTANTLTQAAMMRDIMGTQLALMVGLTATNMATMEQDTGRHTANMRSLADAQFLAMQTEGTNQTGQLRANTAANFLQLQTDGAYQAELLRVQASNSFLGMQADGSYEAAMLRYNSNTEFNDLQTHGVAAAGNLRAGVVYEMAQARSPFTGHVNSLVDVMRRFSDALTTAYGDMGVEVSKPSRIAAATGAILPGFNPGVDNHTFTSPTGGILELSGGEGILRPEGVQAMGPGLFNGINAAARSGGVDGVRRMLSAAVPRQSFADGGIMDAFTSDAKNIGQEYKGLLPDNWLRPAGRSIIDTVVDGMGQYLAEMFTGGGAWVRPTTGRVTSRYGPRGGGHHAGMDIADGIGTPTYAGAAGVVEKIGPNIGPGRTGDGILMRHMDNMWSYHGHNTRGGIRVQPGDAVLPGQRVGDQGTTGNVTGAHLHWEIHQGRAWNDVNPHPFWDAAGPAGTSDVQEVGFAGAGGGSDAYAGIVAQALRLVGLPTTPAYVQAWLRQGQSESGLNPRARQRVNDINMRRGMPAQGIVQVIPPTFSAYSLPGMKDIYNPLHNFAAGMNYAKNRYGVAGMLGVIGHGHGYERGTESALPGWAWVGEAGPELVNFSGGEKVMPHRESVQATRGFTFDYDRMGKAVAKHMPRSAEVNINHPVTRDTDELARRSAEEFRRTLILESQSL